MGKTTFIYTTKQDNFRKDATYENPRYFEKLPPQGLKQYQQVIVVGNWPVVQAALDAAGISWEHGGKDSDKESDVPTYDNTGLVRGAPTGSSQGSAMRQKEGTIVTDLAKNGPVNEGEGDPAQASVHTTGDGEETVAREQGVKTEDIMDGTRQKELAPGHPHPPLAQTGAPEQRPLEEVRQQGQSDGGGDNANQNKSADIPDNWEELSWPEQKALAQNFTNDPIISKANASKSIKDELKRRG